MDENLQTNKSMVHHWEGRTNGAGEELKQLESTVKEEGLFCVEWCVVMSMSMCIMKVVCRFHIMVFVLDWVC